MADIELNATIDEKELAAVLFRLNLAVSDLSPAMRDVGEHVLRTTEKRFRSETDPTGKAWTPLSKAYKRTKRGSKILTESKRLRRSIAYNATRTNLRWGTNVKYAAIHQLGGTIKQKARRQVLRLSKRGRFLSEKKAGKLKAGAFRVRFPEIKAHSYEMPARPYLGISDDDKKAILKILAKHLTKATKRGG